MATMDLATVDQNTKLAITNAQNFLQMNMANLNNEQQGIIIDQQLTQQRLLSNQSAENAAGQFNATSENQKNQFMAGLAQQIELSNTAALNAMSQFNSSELNRMNAINAQNKLAADQYNSQAQQQVTLFDATNEFKRDQWNAQNAQIIEQSNVAWKRQANTIDTAAQNAANQASAQMTFNMSMGEQNYLWQQMRDTASFNQQALQSDKERAMQLLASIYGNPELMGDGSARRAAAPIADALERIIFGTVI